MGGITDKNGDPVDLPPGAVIWGPVIGVGSAFLLARWLDPGSPSFILAAGGLVIVLLALCGVDPVPWTVSG